jgi:hypothetical protein
MGANIMDVGVMSERIFSNRNSYLLVLIIASSLILLNKRKSQVAIKTTPVMLKDGTAGRAVKLSDKNRFNVIDWLGISYKDTDDMKGKLRFYQDGGKQIRIAYSGDTIVKTDKGFTVVPLAQFERFIKI